jgi:hypothetical protein
MFGLFKKKKHDAKGGDKVAKGKDAAVKQPVPNAAKAGSPEQAKLASPAISKGASAKNAKAPAPADKKPAKKSDPEQDALRAAIAILEADAPEVPPLPAKPISAGINLDKAREALAKKASGPMDRKALIEQALAIQQTQAKMLDKLPDATRQKLRALAIKTFGTDAPDDKKKMN